MFQSIFFAIRTLVIGAAGEVLRFLFGPLYAGLILFGPPPGGHHSQLWFPLAFAYAAICGGVVLGLLDKAKATQQPVWGLLALGVWTISWLLGRIRELRHKRQRAAQAQSQDD